MVLFHLLCLWFFLSCFVQVKPLICFSFLFLTQFQLNFYNFFWFRINFSLAYFLFFRLELFPVTLISSFLFFQVKINNIFLSLTGEWRTAWNIIIFWGWEERRWKHMKSGHLHQNQRLCQSLFSLLFFSTRLLHPTYSFFLFISISLFFV